MDKKESQMQKFEDIIIQATKHARIAVNCDLTECGLEQSLIDLGCKPKDITNCYVDKMNWFEAVHILSYFFAITRVPFSTDMVECIDTGSAGRSAWIIKTKDNSVAYSLGAC